VSLVSVWGGNWCHSCERVEGVEKGGGVEIANIHHFVDEVGGPRIQWTGSGEQGGQSLGAFGDYFGQGERVMPLQVLKPGDRVVELGGLAVTAAVATGAVAGAWVVWLIKKSWLASAGSFIAGAVIGFVAGELVARIRYRTGENRTVAKVGTASLSATIPAGLVGGVVTGIAVGLLASLIFSARDQALFEVAIGCGIVLGVLFACLSSLT